MSATFSPASECVFIMIGGQTDCRVDERLTELCAQFANDDSTEVEIPLTQIDLAERWNISRGSVQKFLNRKQRQGEVISKHPLRLDASVIMRQPRPLGLRPPNSSWLDVISTAVVSAAEAGQLEVVLALEERLFHRLGHHTSPIDVTASDFVGAPSARQAGRAEARQGAFSGNCELELEEIHSDSAVSEGRADGRAEARQSDSFSRSAQKILRGGKTPEQTVLLVQRRIHGKELRSQGATPPWLRTHAWSAPSWTAADLEQLKGEWHGRFGSELGDQLVLALRLWPPQAASIAVAELASTTGLRNYEGQLLDAAIWGYHKYFPITPASPVDLGNSAVDRLAAALHSEADFIEPEEVRDHIASLVSLGQPPGVILERLAMQLIQGNVPVSVLSTYETHEWTAAEIEAEACRILETLGETP